MLPEGLSVLRNGGVPPPAPQSTTVHTSAPHSSASTHGRGREGDRLTATWKKTHVEVYEIYCISVPCIYHIWESCTTNQPHNPKTQHSSKICRLLVLKLPVLLCDTACARVSAVVPFSFHHIAFSAKHLVLDVDLRVNISRYSSTIRVVAGSTFGPLNHLCASTNQ